MLDVNELGILLITVHSSDVPYFILIINNLENYKICINNMKCPAI